MVNILCHTILFHPTINKHKKELLGHFIPLRKMKYRVNENILTIKNSINNNIVMLHTLEIIHPLIRNYNNIIKNKTMINYDIVELVKIYDNNGFYIKCAIKKTFWIRIFQKVWRKYMKKRAEIIKNRCRPDALFYRELHGKWQHNSRF